MTSTFTTNKGYQKQGTGDNPNAWGTILNTNCFDVIDKNLGGTLALSVAGSSNVTLTSAQAQNLIYNFTGALTGNINVIFPAAGGIYYISNQTTGGFTLTIQAGSSTSGLLVPQGTQVPVYVDNSTSPPTVGGFRGTDSVYVGSGVGGTANAITVSTTQPTGFVLQVGAEILVTPLQPNTGSTTLNVNGTGAITIKKIGPTGLSNLVGGEIIPAPLIFQYDGTQWVFLNFLYQAGTTTISGNTTAPIVYLGGDVVATAALTLSLAQTTTGNYVYWYGFNLSALGGNVVLSPNAADAIKVNGQTLSAGASYTIPQGASCRIATDTAGFWYVYFIGPRLNAEATLASATTTDLGTASSNVVQITGTTTITAFGSTASVGNPIFFIRFNNTLTLTYNATSLIIPGGLNITTLAGDSATVKYEGSGNWRVLSYTKATGSPIWLNPITNSIGGDVSLSSIGSFFDGPSIAQGTSGTWFVSGKVTLGDTGSSAANYIVKLWDGTTVVDSSYLQGPAINQYYSVSLSGFITSPAANLRISVRNQATTSSSIKASVSGVGKDSTITAIRIA